MKLPAYKIQPSGRMFKLTTGRLTFFAATRQRAIQRLILWLTTNSGETDEKASS